MPICRWCGAKNPKFIKCHIVPEYFFRKITKNYEGSDKILTKIDRAGKQKFEKVSKASPRGLFDNEIVCHACETEIFKPIDNSVIQNFFEKEKDLEIFFEANDLSLLHYSKYNPQNLYAYALSVLLRASYSSKCKQVHLEKYEKIIKDEILNPTFRFKVFLIHHKPSKDKVVQGVEEEAADTFMELSYRKIKPRMYRLYWIDMARYQFGIHLTDQKINGPGADEKMQILPNRNIPIFSIPFERSYKREMIFEIMADVFRNDLEYELNAKFKA